MALAEVADRSEVRRIERDLVRRLTARLASETTGR